MITISWSDSLCGRTAACVVVGMSGGVLATVNVGVAVAVARSRIVITPHLLSTVGLPEHQQHLVGELQSRAEQDSRPVVVARPGVGRVGGQQSLHAGVAKLAQLSSWLPDMINAQSEVRDISRLSHLLSVVCGLIITKPIHVLCMLLLD